MSASLATNTGPRLSGQQWSTAAEQLVHVGESVRFDFVLTDWDGSLLSPIGLADYCAAYVGGERIEVGFDPNGHFRFDFVFDAVAAGETIAVAAEAFRQVGGRDFINAQGEWFESQSPYEVADKQVAGDNLLLRFYRATIELPLARPADDLEPDTGVLRIRRSDGSVSSVYVDRPGRPGFELSGPDGMGFYHVRYSPTGAELNATGTTEVEFVIFDVAGQRHRVASDLPTP